jgi:hypothetical protein
MIAVEASDSHLNSQGDNVIQYAAVESETGRAGFGRMFE